MIIFTSEEIQLAACYQEAESRIQMIKKIVKDRDGMEKEVWPVAMTLVDKLAKMSDKEFKAIEFQTEMEW